MKNYDLERNTAEAEKLLAHIEAIKKHASFILDYCTNECENCPIRGFCDWDGNLDFSDEGMQSMERLVDYLEYHDKVQEKREREEADAEYDAWEAANRWAGIDPSWANLPRVGRI